MEGEGVPQIRGRTPSVRREGLFGAGKALVPSDARTQRNLGGYTDDGAKTVIPSKAYAKISTRLVPNQDPAVIARLVEGHVRRLLPKSVACKFDVLSPGQPWLADYRHEIFQKAMASLEKVFAKKAVFIREGGSIPFVAQINALLKIPCVLLGFGLPDENAHAPNEHLSLDNYFGGLRSVALFYKDLGIEDGRSGSA